MLRAILISAVSALLYTAIAAILDIVFLKDFKVKASWVTRHVIRFAVRFIWLVIFMYLSCKPFTIVTALTWMWSAEIFMCFMIVMAVCIGIPIEEDKSNDKSKDKSEDKSEEFDFAVYTIMATISVVVCIFGCFAPTQEMVNINNIAESKMVGSESVSSVLQQFKNTVGNKYSSSRFSVENSGMRRINDEDVLVYHVSSQSSEQYIPGYVIQNEGKSLEVIQKRIYFDESFYFGKDAKRAVRKKYQTEILGKHMFDIDDEYNPYEIFLYRENLLFSDGGDYGIIVLNLNDGTSEKYSESSGEIPEWVDFKSTYPR